MNFQFIDEISSKIIEIVKSSPTSELEGGVRALLKGIFSNMELVTREELEVQNQVLLQTRNKLEMLEQKLNALEQHLASGK